MKLKIFDIGWDELQDYLDKFEDKIKHIIPYKIMCSDSNAGKRFILIIDEA